MIEIISHISEIAVSEVATAAIEEISKKHKISPFHLAMNVDGLIHDHPPCEYNVKTCSYCKRNGNIFAKDDSRNETNDVISKYKQKAIVLFEEMFREITNIVNEKSFVDDEVEDEELDLDDMLEKAFGKPHV
ncbi:hypothetical protein NY2A_B197L [Paramecium bursaria Chlorella virus NY2A]|uniref:Uncharacterized protein B197L n=1 Tax=Paramecium bursaria Chlorella virus NY2A TaxID=46021 RepID=A7IW72_PBCVN|nr:hypothetical protein NY2A_B197L [Paramecium bursaria Chlorella virus NY2A]YP_001498269.1 hypothetical protein AR158_C187L [Paramecium bursaria Chlorella virus AR158]ABT14596.1 hypothetical protein NY2A_B197L [Paramecium bursaria Chlorella virus NY2A]ABU43733.1 hypothetical protein AR158_C187L [Paramecium bursaria Chlorella virus AR158]